MMNEPENYLFSHMNRLENEMAIIRKEAIQNKRAISDIVTISLAGCLISYFVYKTIDHKIQKLEKEISEKNNAKTKEE